MSLDKALEALEFAHGAILDAIGLEDGLDGEAGHRVLLMIRGALAANGREPLPIPGDDESAPPNTPMASVSLLESESSLRDRIAALPIAYPPRHARYLVKRGMFWFTATPCYGMHDPWWVVMTMEGEVPPVAMQDGDEWLPLAQLDALLAAAPPKE